jgi:hypothetical protein
MPQSKTNKGNQTSDLACYTRCDTGWAEGMHPLDVFLKNTHEVLGPLHSATAHDVLSKLEFLTDDLTLRQATYGKGENVTKVIVNFGTREAQVKSTLGGQVILPPWGFVIEAPRFTAFYACRWNGQTYDKGALFTLKAMNKKNLKEADRIRVFHAFGAPTIRWNGKIHKVQREQEIRS